MSVPRYFLKEAIAYLRDIENNIPKHFWPSLVRKGWMVIEKDGTPNWNTSVTSRVSDEDLADFVVRCRADIYFNTVGVNIPPRVKHRSAERG